MLSRRYTIERQRTELEYKRIAIENDAYAIILSDKVKVDIYKRRISAREIDQTIFHLPHTLFTSNRNEDFLIDCQQTGVRMIVSKNEFDFTVLLARRAGELAIY